MWWNTHNRLSTVGTTCDKNDLGKHAVNDKAGAFTAVWTSKIQKEKQTENIFGSPRKKLKIRQYYNNRSFLRYSYYYVLFMCAYERKLRRRRCNISNTFASQSLFVIFPNLQRVPRKSLKQPD